jgi:HAMP domain-containing protein
MKNINLKNYSSLKFKITLTIVVSTLFVLSVVFTASYLNIKKIIKDDFNLRLLNEVSIAALQIDPNKHSQLKNISDENREEYSDIKLTLQKIRDNSTDIYYIYTLKETKDNNISFVVDAEENPDNLSHIGEIYDDANKFLIDNFFTMNKPIVENDFTTDKWGTWISAYAPFYDKYGVREGVLGIDTKASSIIEKQNNILLVYILIFFISGIFSILIGIFLSKNLLKSVSNLSDLLKNSKYFSESEEVNIGNDEINQLAKVLKSTINKVDISQKNSENNIENKNKILEKMNELMVGRELEMIKLKKELNELKKEKEIEIE